MRVERALAETRHGARIEAHDRGSRTRRAGSAPTKVSRAVMRVELGPAVDADQRRIRLRRIERRRKLHQPAKRRRPVGGREREQLRLLQPHRRRAATRRPSRSPTTTCPSAASTSRAAGGVSCVWYTSTKCVLSGAMPHGARQRRLLRPRAEVRNAVADRVVKRRIGQAAIVAAVEPDAMQLQLERVVAVARGVEEHAGRLVDLHQLVRFVASSNDVSGAISRPLRS